MHAGVTRTREPGRWRLRVQIHDQKTGRPLSYQRTVDAPSETRAAVLREQWREELVAGGGREHAPGRLRLSEYAERWASANAYRWRMSTRTTIAGALVAVLPELGDTYLDRLDRTDVQRWLSGQVGAGLAPTTVNGRYRVLRSLLRDAQADGYLEHDPTYRVPRVPQPPVEKPALTADELGRLLETCRTRYPQHHALLATGFLTGARWSELTALTWDDLDESSGTITFRRGQWHGHVGPTKTSRARTVPLADGLLDLLREHRQRLVSEQHPGLGTGLMFPARCEPGDAVGKGHRWSPSMDKVFDRLCQMANVNKHVRAHTMRRTFNNLLRQAGVDTIAIQAMTGHSSDAMTEHYSHVDLAERRRAVERLRLR